ncbi:GntR family transcriptional regulator [Niameybacter massiliensis]|uniref:GntR family transcriptional regulator n=1 Tax=Holtiella tumoricola TaxID=3018743 RepID=A0AA42J068_9FIRM|nr:MULTISPECIES: GntR family transcriptional regulator [Lachnospirales]MDA3731075.1 GntR family transcriptional regulator [Holtiella tumoricola]
MPWDFDTTRPIYMQLVERIKLMIVTGELPSGSKLKSVRDLAEEAGVNPNTMQRALAELERDALVYSQRTSGRFVTEDKELLAKMRDEFAEEKVKSFIESLMQLGYKQDEVITLIQHYLGGMK